MKELGKLQREVKAAGSSRSTRLQSGELQHHGATEDTFRRIRTAKELLPADTETFYGQMPRDEAVSAFKVPAGCIIHPIGKEPPTYVLLFHPTERTKPWSLSFPAEQVPDELSLLGRIMRAYREGCEAEAEAAGELASDTFVPELITALFSSEHTSDFPIVEAANLADAVNESCQHLTESLLEGIGNGAGISELGISGVILTFAAGTSAELAIAPIAKKCGFIARALEFGGILLGILTGNHVLIVACTKKLLISQANHVVAKGIAQSLLGSHPAPEPGASRQPKRLVEIPAHTLTVTPDQLPVELGRDLEQWFSRLTSQEDDS